MNADSPEHDARVEALLRSIPPPSLPPEWRAAILQAARPPAWPWLPRPLKLGLAAAWAAIGLLHFTSPPGLPPAAENAGAAQPAGMAPGPGDLTAEQWLAAMEFHPPSAP